MINPREFKLSGNEFKIIQYLKIKNDDTQEEMAYKLKLSTRTIRDTLQVLTKLRLIDTINLNKNRLQYKYKYKVNDVEKWIL